MRLLRYLVNGCKDAYLEIIAGTALVSAGG